MDKNELLRLIRDDTEVQEAVGAMICEALAQSGLLHASETARAIRDGLASARRVVSARRP